MASSGMTVKSITLRVISIISFAVAAIVLFFSSQRVIDAQSGNFIVEKFHNWDAFLLCLVVDIIGCIYNLLVLALPNGSQLWKTVIVLDVIVDILIGASLGAGWQTYSFIKKGNMHTRWWALCDGAHFFCSKLLGSLITSTFGFFISIMLLIYILHRTVDPFLVTKD